MIAVILYVLGFAHFILEVNRLNDHEIMKSKDPAVSPNVRARKERMYSPSVSNTVTMIFFAAAWPLIVVLDIIDTLRGPK